MTLDNQLESPSVKIPIDARILVLCMAGSVRSPELKWILEQNGYKNVDYGGVGEDPVKKRATREMLEWANVIIAVAPDVAEMLANQYTLRGNQRIIGLEVYDIWDPITRTTPDLHEIGESLEKQIGSYLD